MSGPLAPSHPLAAASLSRRPAHNGTLRSFTEPHYYSVIEISIEKVNKAVRREIGHNHFVTRNKTQLGRSRVPVPFRRGPPLRVSSAGFQYSGLTQLLNARAGSRVSARTFAVASDESATDVSDCVVFGSAAGRTDRRITYYDDKCYL